MSGSPKYTRVSLRRSINAALRAQRAAAAAQARAARQAEQERRRAARQTQQERELAARVSDHKAGANADVIAVRSRVSSASPTVQTELAALEQRLSRASSVEEVRLVRRLLREFGERVSALEAASRAARHTSDLTSAEDALSSLQRRVGGIDPALSERFDSGMGVRIRSLLTEAANALALKAPAKCNHVLKQAAELLTAHEVRVQAGLDREHDEQAERHQCRVVIDDAGDRLAGLRADATVVKWCPADIAQLLQTLAGAEASLRAGRWAEVRDAVAGIGATADAIAERAQEAQLVEDKRRYVVNGIVQALGQLGFVVQSGSPALEDPGQAGSSVIIHARRVGGGAVAVSVPQQGDIWYDLDGYPKRTESTRDGQVLASCDEAEAQITRLHDVLEAEFGIETDGLHWQGKDPNRILRRADQLPGGHAAGSTPAGGA